MMVYAAFHFLNHALGHISLEAMETVLTWQSWIWQSWPGTIVLYGALLIHACLGVWKVAMLDTHRLPAWDWLQILLGLSMPVWLASHLVYTRWSEFQIGLEVDYSQELALIWSGAILQQTALLLMVWVHGCIGIHFWLRIRDGYLILLSQNATYNNSAL